MFKYYVTAGLQRKENSVFCWLSGISKVEEGNYMCLLKGTKESETAGFLFSVEMKLVTLNCTSVRCVSQGQSTDIHYNRNIVKF